MSLFSKIEEKIIEHKKDNLREEMRDKRHHLTKEAISVASVAIVKKIEKQEMFQNAQTVMVYYPLGNEVNVRELLERWKDQKTILLPVVLPHHKMELRQYTGKENMTVGKLGVKEPTTPAWEGDVDLAIIPGVAFDYEGHRMGRGGGYYDRFLEERNIKTIGVGYKFQLVKKLPTLGHDQKMDKIITD